MKIKNKLVAAIAALALSASASATVETFNGAAGAHGGTYNGFTLDGATYFHTAGRPYLEYYTVAHSITAAGTFTFNSIDFSFWPWDGYGGGSGNSLHIQFLGLSNNVLLDTFVTLPTNGSWITYSQLVQNVHTISFLPTNGFWPSFDNLVYNATSDVPEPTSLALIGLGLAGLGLGRRATRRA